MTLTDIAFDIGMTKTNSTLDTNALATVNAGDTTVMLTPDYAAARNQLCPYAKSLYTACMIGFEPISLHSRPQSASRNETFFVARA